MFNVSRCTPEFQATFRPKTAFARRVFVTIRTVFISSNTTKEENPLALSKGFILAFWVSGKTVFKKFKFLLKICQIHNHKIIILILYNKQLTHTLKKKKWPKKKIKPYDPIYIKFQKESIRTESESVCAWGWGLSNGSWRWIRDQGGIEENFCGDKNVHNLDWGEPSQGYTGQNSNYTL